MENIAIPPAQRNIYYYTYKLASLVVCCIYYYTTHVRIQSQAQLSNSFTLVRSHKWSNSIKEGTGT